MTLTTDKLATLKQQITELEIEVQIATTAAINKNYLEHTKERLEEAETKLKSKQDELDQLLECLDHPNSNYGTW